MMNPIKNSLKEFDHISSNFDTQIMQDRLNDVLDDVRVSQLISQWNLTIDDVRQNLSIFSRYLSYLDNPNSSEINVPEGYDLVLTYNNQVFGFEYRLKPEIEKYQQARSHLRYFLINHMPKENELLRFNTFELSGESSDYANVLKNLVLLSKGIYPDDQPQGLFLYGAIGCGKTYLLSAFANEMANDKKSVCFVKISQLITELKESFNQYQSEAETLLYRMKTCECLILDDLGSEHISRWSRDEILFQVLDYRMENKQLTMCSSNYDFKSLMEVYNNASNSIDKTSTLRLMERLSVLCRFTELKSSSGISRRQQ